MASEGKRLIGLTAIAMLAFAANSVLNRMAVGQGLIAPLAFALVRVVAGAAMLGLIMLMKCKAWPGWQGRIAGVAGLLAYLVGFSLAYVSLDAGIGALILFGVVQITMFAGAVLGAEDVPPRRWVGAGVAFAGLVVLLAPGGVAVSLPHAGLMTIAGVGWGIYSLAGRGQADPLAATAANFGLAVPVLMLGMMVMPGAVDWAATTPLGLMLAILSGAVTSGLGYALWYTVLPGLGAARAAVAQLTVPVLAAAAGAVLIGEGVGLRFAFATVLVLGGVALAVQSGLKRR